MMDVNAAPCEYHPYEPIPMSDYNDIVLSSMCTGADESRVEDALDQLLGLIWEHNSDWQELRQLVSHRNRSLQPYKN